MLESKIQKKIMIWLQSKGCHVIKYDGTITGEPDLIAALPIGNGMSLSLFIEVKNEKGRLSPIQKVTLNKLRAEGHLALIARDVKEIGGYLTKSGVKLPDLGELAIYGRWKGMRARCYQKNNHHYPRYGGRGITMCDRWIEPVMGYYNFIDDMGLPPFNGASIDRIDNDGNYSPENCRWATSAEQANNTSRNRLITANGRTQTLSKWAEETRIGHKTISGRLARGWTEDNAVNVTPEVGRNQSGSNQYGRAK